MYIKFSKIEVNVTYLSMFQVIRVTNKYFTRDY